MQAALDRVENVTQVAVDENFTDSVDAHGLPPHSVYAVVANGADADMAAALWRTKAPGCAMVGARTFNVVCAHSMRGLHSTLAVDVGVTGRVVAASLGHERVSTTVQSYAKAEAVSGAPQRR